MPPSLLAMFFINLLYAPLPACALEPATPRASGRRCSLFPQEGCPLARHSREGHDEDADDFGVCVAWPVRALVAVPLGPSLQLAHKAPTHKPALAHRREMDGESFYQCTFEWSSPGHLSRNVRHGQIFGWPVVL